MRSAASGPADADGDGGVGGVVGGRSPFGGGAGGGVDTATQRDEVARVGVAQAVDGEVAQERAGVGERPFGQAFGEGLADLVPVAVAHRAAAKPVGPSVGTDRDGGGGRRGLLGRLCLCLLAGRGRGVVAGRFLVGVHVPGEAFQMVIRISAGGRGRVGPASVRGRRVRHACSGNRDATETCPEKASRVPVLAPFSAEFQFPTTFRPSWISRRSSTRVGSLPARAREIRDRAHPDRGAETAGADQQGGGHIQRLQAAARVVDGQPNTRTMNR
jgi:hypothetical protein